MRSSATAPPRVCTAYPTAPPTPPTRVTPRHSRPGGATLHNGGVDEPNALNPAMRWGSIVAVWVLALVAAIAIGLFSTSETFAAWLGIALAGCMIAALCVQLATQEKRGFIDRLAASVSGALVVLAITSGLLALLHFS